MPLADCLAKVDLDPKEAEALKARAAELVASGTAQDAAELQAAKEFSDRVSAQAEDIRGQIGAPGPVDIPSADVASAGASQLLDAHIDELFQAVTLRKGSETLKKYGLKPGGTYTTRQVAAALEARQRAKWGSIDPKDRSPEAQAKIAKWMADEVEFEMQNPEKSGAGWYGVKFQRALDIFAEEFPELAFDKNSRDVFTALVAITSNGEKVFTNFTNAADIYKAFKDTGRFEMSRGSQREGETAIHLQRLQDLYDRMGAAEMSKFLMQQKTVKELKQIAAEQELDFSTDYQVDIVLPMGAVILGPKLGAFYANLMGADGYLTMDRWWSRTFNRYRGVLLGAPTKAGLERFKGLLGKPEISDDEALAETVSPTEAYSAKGFKNGTEIEKAANTLYKAAFVNLRDIPDNSKDRTFMLGTVAKAKSNLKRRGFNTSVADIQAILWYFEKRLYGEMGARDSADVSYEEAAARVVSERLNRPLPAEQDRTPIGEEEMNPVAPMGDPRVTVSDMTPLAGLPESSPGPVRSIVEAAKKYVVKAGLPVRRQKAFVKADPARGARIAKAFEAMKHDPQSPDVKAAYKALIDETLAQYQSVKELGLKVEIIKSGMADPYPEGPKQVLDDLRKGHLRLYPTESGFGDGAIQDNPLLAPTDEYIDGQRLLANDVFRIVHDVFGHGKEGVGFGPSGEENTWQSHMRMYSPLAARAATTETRGQNSWVNFGPHGEANRANQKATVYADQKVGLLPEWVMNEGVEDGPEDASAGIDEAVELADFTTDLAGALLRPGWSVITATQEALGDATVAANVQANADLEAELIGKGVEFLKVKGVYEGADQGASFLILSDLPAAEKLGAKYRQESVLTNAGLTYNDGSVVPAGGVKIGEAAKAEAFHSVLPDGRAFSVKLDFNARFKPAKELQQSKPKKGELPRTVKEAVEIGKPFKLIHWSSTPGLKSLDPKFAGTAGAGQEAALYKQGLKKRLNFGLMGRYRLESMVPATAAYEVTVDPEEVYDIYEDPLGIRARASEKFPSDAVKRRNWADDQGRKAGFKFFYSSKEGPWFPVLYSLDRVSVKQIDDPVGKGLVRPEMPAPTDAERATYLKQSAIQTVGAESLGNTFDSRREFFQSAYHGTGNSEVYDKLSYDAVGGEGGEGTQFEGWGLYVTTEKGVAEWYRDQNSAGIAKASPVQQAKQDAEAEIDALARAAVEASAEAARARGEKPNKAVLLEMLDLVGGGVTEEYLRQNTASLEELPSTLLYRQIIDASKWALANGYAETLAKLSAAVDAADVEDRQPRVAGRVYTVDIPDDTGDNYLDWNRPLKKHPRVLAAVQRAVDRLIEGMPEKGRNHPGMWMFLGRKSGGNPPDGVVRDRVESLTGREAYKLMSSMAGQAHGLDFNRDKAVSDALAAEGIVGNRYLGDEGNGDYYNYVIFQDVPIREYRQTGNGEARGSLKIVDDKYIVSLFDGADLSTVLHETGHIFLEEMHNVVANGYAGPRTIEDYNTLMGWLGNEGEAITRNQHETFAVNFEAYLLRGKAPTKSLSEAFGTFRRWLTRIYEKVVTGDARAGLEQVGGAKVNLTPEVIEVFDRLLTLESESQLNEMDLELAIPPGAKGEDDKFKAQRTRISDLMDSARQKLEDRLYARRAAAISEKLEGWKAQAEKDLKDLPIYKAAEYLKSAPLDVATLIDRYGKRVSSLLQSKGLAAADGLGTDPDTVAAEFGFDSGKSLVDLLRDTPSLPYAIRRVVKGKADAEWSSYTAADAMAETPEYQEVLAASGEYFAQSLGRKSSDQKGVRAEAERMLANLPVGEAVKVDRFLQTMAKLQRQERAAAVKGNFDEALARNRQSRVHLEAARIARGMKDDVEAIEARVNKMSQAKAGSVDFNFHINALVLAVRHQLLPIRVLALPGIEKVPALRSLLTAQKDPDSELYEPAMDVLAGFSDEVIDGRWLDNDGKALHWKSLTIDQLTELDHLMRFLETRGRQMVSDKILGGKVKAEDAAAEIMTVASRLTDKKVFEEGSVGQRATKFTDGYLAALNLWLFRVRAMDGFKNISPEGRAGPAEKYLYDPLHEKSNERYVRFEKLMASIGGPMAHFQKRMRDYPKYVDIGVPVTEDMRKNGRVGWTFENILVVALNSGNIYNAEAMARGLGMVTEGEPDVARLQSITKIMTEEDWAQVQNIWDTVNSLWPDLASVFERRNGFPLAKVEADPFEVITADGKQIQVKGGYYPVKFDTALSDRAAEQSEAEELANAAGAMFPLVGTKKGMTIKRTNTGGKPLSLSLGSLTSHLRDTVQYVSYSETVVDVYRIVRDPAFKQLFVQKFGKDAYQNIRKMLAEIGLPEAGMIDQWDRALDNMRGAATAWMLGLNFGTVVKQIPAIFNYASDEGWTNLALGLKGFAAAPISVTKDIRELSPFMAEREMAADRDVADALKMVNWLDKPRLRKVQQAMFYPIRIMDSLLARPMWYGSYTRRLRDGMSPADAANEADKAIAATVPGNTRPLDLSALQRDKRGWMRLLTSFSTSTFHFGSRQRFYMHAVREGAINPAQYGYKIFVEGMVAPMATLAMMDLLWGNWPPEEEKAKKYWLELGAYQFVGMPILREVVNLSLSDQPRKFGESIPTFSGLDMLVGGVRSMAKLAEDLSDPDEKKTQRALWAVADLVSFVTRVPASRVFERSYEGIRQAEAFNDDDKWLNELNDAFTILIPDPDKRGQK
jgi:hypothetical protein